jgi:uncharacterized protein YdeI (YjbR/CyaY-like superfamily)
LEVKEGITTTSAKSALVWRKWLEKNHVKEKSVFLIIYRKKCDVPSVYYSEAVDEALCFGWIDSVPKKRDAISYYVLFSKRNPKSNWSRVNKLKVEGLLKEGKMTTAGQKMIDLAKATGTWTALDQVSDLIVPEDLQNMLLKNKKALKHFEAFSPSAKRGILEWVHSAKRTETRQKRLKEIVQLAAQNIKANHYQPSKK